MILTPSYHELTKMSNSELVKTMRPAKVQLIESKQLGENGTEKEHIYLLVQHKWEKRLRIGNRFYR